MSLRFNRSIARFMIVVAFALMFAFMAGNLGMPRAYAASVNTSVTTNAYTPADVLFWSLTTSNTQRAGVNFGFHLQWESGQYGSTGYTAYWGDGSSDLYSCWLNCGSGTHDYTHFFRNDGTYTNSVQSSLGGNGPWITVHVVG